MTVTSSVKVLFRSHARTAPTPPGCWQQALPSCDRLTHPRRPTRPKDTSLRDRVRYNHSAWRPLRLRPARLPFALLLRRLVPRVLARTCRVLIRTLPLGSRPLLLLLLLLPLTLDLQLPRLKHAGRAPAAAPASTLPSSTLPAAALLQAPATRVPLGRVRAAPLLKACVAALPSSILPLGPGPLPCAPTPQHDPCKLSCLSVGVPAPASASAAGG